MPDGIRAPPASHSQLRTLTDLIERAGHADFKDARGPLGFTQRQAGGKFTSAEADEFIAALDEAERQTESIAPADAIADDAPA